MTIQDNLANILIVGGGSAGWITANLLAHQYRNQPVNISLVESEDIGIIGVGEGSTPHLKQFFDKIDVTEAQWMPACNATYKNGILFKNWSVKPGYTQYFHPFASKIDGFTAPVFIHNCLMKRKGIDIHAHPDRYYLSAHLAEHLQSPVNPEHFPFEIGYGYHFDSALLGQFLKTLAKEKGVNHIVGNVIGADHHPSGDLKSVQLDNGAPVEADFFVDCTGFRALLIDKQLGVEHISFKDNLFNDAAVTLPSPIRQHYNAQTFSTALSAGWAWQIPLINRDGNGYVYSKQYLSADQAETELRQHLGLLDADVEANHLNMRVGRRRQHWHKNVLAVGLSQGFIEPLEATAIHLTIETVNQFIRFRHQHDDIQSARDGFNQDINQRFESIRDYIVAHYKLNSRTDSQYWIDNAQNNKLSQPLMTIIQAWFNGQDLNQEIAHLRLTGYYPPFSWHCIFAGYGIFPDQNTLMQGNSTSHRYDLDDIDNFIRRSALNFPEHKSALEQLHTNLPTL